MRPSPRVATAQAEGVPRYEPLSDEVKQRVRWLLARAPRGRVVTYMAALGMVGAPAGFARALPAYLKAWAAEAAPALTPADGEAGEAAPTDVALEALPVHRMTATSGALVERYVPGQRAALEAEGVRVLTRKGEACVDLRACRWQPSHAELYLRAAHSCSPPRQD